LFSVLYVDDEELLLSIGKIFLEKTGELLVTTVSSANKAFEALSNQRYDAIISDYQMPDMDGIEFLKSIRALGNTIPFIIFTGRGREEIVIEALNAGADFYLQKGGEAKSQFAELAHKVKRSIVTWNAEDQRRMNEIRLNVMMQLYSMSDLPVKEITDFALEKAVDITESSMGYLAFLSDDEKKLFMYSWSEAGLKECKLIEKPIVYDVEKTGLWGEAVRQRKPVTTNDYPAENPLKRGTPMGHVTLIRHMNLPVFDHEKIVMVIGVANKKSYYNNEDVRQLTLLMNGLWNIVNRKKTEDELLEKNHKLAAAYEQIAASEEELKQQLEELALRETKLKASENRLRAIINGSPFGAHIYELTDLGELIFKGSNKAADRILGIDHGRIIGKTIEEAFPSLVNTDIPALYKAIARTGDGVTRDEVYYSDDGVISGSFQIHAFQISPGNIAVFFLDMIKEKKARLIDSDERFRNV